MIQTEEFKKAIKGFKKAVKFSALLDKSSTYIKVNGSSFNGQVYPDLSDLDVDRIKKAIKVVKKRTEELELVFNGKLNKKK